MDATQRSALITAAVQRCASLPELPTLMATDECPTIDAFDAARRLGSEVTMYPIHLAGLGFKKQHSEWQGTANAWVIVSAGVAWITTSGKFVDEIYDKHLDDVWKDRDD